MTMKTKKTLQHIAAVAVVLLALLVFTAPVSADDVTPDSSWYNVDGMEFTISTESELAGFVDLVNTGTTFDGQVIILASNINLDSVEVPDGIVAVEIKKILSLNVDGFEKKEEKDAAILSLLNQAFSNPYYDIIEVESSTASSYGKAGVVVVSAGEILDGKGKTLEVTKATGTWDCAVNARGGTIKDLTIVSGFRGIFMSDMNGDVHIENVIFDGTVYTISLDEGRKDFSIYVNDSTLNGWTSYAATIKGVEFNNCHFGEGSGYAYCRPYAVSVFNNCVFEDGFVIDTSRVKLPNTITFNNCDYGTTLITKGNAANLELFTDVESLVVKPDYQYIVSFDANGGEGVMDSQPFVSDISQTLTPNAFTRDGHTFNEWNTAEDGSGTAYSDEASVRNIAKEEGAILTLYANWTKNIYDLFATPEKVGFDSVKVGYTQPEAQPVIVKNVGNVPVTINKPTYENFDVIDFPTDAEISPGEELTLKIQPKAGLAVGNYGTTLEVTNTDTGKATFEVSFLVYQPSSGGSSTTKPEEPVEPEIPVEPENPTEEPEAGEPSVETEVTDGGEVLFEAPVEPETPGADTPSDEPAEPTVTGVELPAGTDSEVAFIPVSEKPAPAGKETQTKKVFEINVPKYEKGKPATVKFTMTVAELAADGKTAADVALWHQDEETGEWTKLVTTFVIIDGVVYFEAITFDFSPFAIVYEDVSAPTEPETPEQPTESPAPILAVLAGLGAAAVLRRK